MTPEAITEAQIVELIELLERFLEGKYTSLPMFAVHVRGTVDGIKAERARA